MFRLAHPGRDDGAVVEAGPVSEPVRRPERDGAVIVEDDPKLFKRLARGMPGLMEEVASSAVPRK
jgi:hypothetical protein